MEVWHAVLFAGVAGCGGFNGQEDAAGKYQCFFSDVPVTVTDEVRCITRPSVAIPPVTSIRGSPVGEGVLEAGDDSALEVTVVVHGNAVA